MGSTGWTRDPYRTSREDPMRMAYWFVVVCTLTVGSFIPSIAVAHERKEVAGLMVLFGAEPEPVLTKEV